MALAVFDTADSNQLTLEEIDAAIERYPYFPVLYYIRSGKLIAEGRTDANDSMAKTALYFPNPHWLNHQLKPVKAMPAEHEASMAERLITPHDSAAVMALEQEVDLPEMALQEEELDAAFDSRRVFGEEDVEADVESDDIIPMGEFTELAELAHTINEPSGGTEPSGEAVVPVEPLYTIDYFASQGIKLAPEDLPGDQLAVKLKSFTEWLKSMKKIHPEKMDRQMDQETEKQIRLTAEHSNENSEVHTEALAEVYLKQGLDDKAIAVYKKLSLLDPAKSAYFAARIREIKEI